MAMIDYPRSFAAATTVLPSSLPTDPLPSEWAVYLLSRLEMRRPQFDIWQAYYDGNHPLSFFTQAFRSAFGERWRRFSSNFAMLVVDGLAERMEVQGFRFRDETGDQDLWDVWQENDLDGVSQQAHTAALIKGITYALVEPRPGEKGPRITVEDACDAIVHVDPRDPRKRLAGLKRYLDDDGRMVVILYLPDGWWYWRTEQPLTPDLYVWSDPKTVTKLLVPWVTEDHPDGFVPSPLPVVPLIPLLNRPGLDGIGKSEIAAITSNQDAINYYRAAAIIAARQMATPQRYLLNFDVEIDPDTGRPRQPFITQAGEPGNLWTVGNPEPSNGAPPLWKPEAGQFPAADVTQFLRLIEGEVWQIASISRLPYQELLQSNSSVPQSGEALKASEASLVRKMSRASIHFGEGWEEVMRTALLAQGDERSTLRTAETMWQSAETRNEAVRTDAVTKLRAADIIDDQTAWELLGMSPGQIERQKDRMAASTIITREQADIAGILVRTGWEPDAVLKALGFPPIPHTGLVPVTVTQDPEEAAKAKAEAAAKAPPPPVQVPAPAGPRMSTTTPVVPPVNS
jgi:hypothetical protein